MYLAEAHGVRADARLVAGPPALALGRVAERDGGRLIVIGSRRSGRLRALLRGSVSRQLAKFGRTPVVIVPEDGRDGSRDGRPAARHAML
jgi:nucleotide-binding universal stress UspA family protein